MSRWQAIATLRGRELVLGDRHFVCRAGAPISAAVIVMQGSLERLAVAQDGRGLFIDVLGPGTLLGVAEIASGLGEQPFDVRCLGAVTVRTVHNEVVREILAHDSTAVREALKLTGRQLAQAELAKVMLADAEARVRAVLRAYARAAGVTHGGVTELLVRRTQSDVAEACGITLRQAQRVFHKLRVRGVIKEVAGRYAIADRLGRSANRGMEVLT